MSLGAPNCFFLSVAVEMPSANDKATVPECRWSETGSVMLTKRHLEDCKRRSPSVKTFASRQGTGRRQRDDGPARRQAMTSTIPEASAVRRSTLAAQTAFHRKALTAQQGPRAIVAEHYNLPAIPPRPNVMQTAVQAQYEVSPMKLWSPLQRQLAACGQRRGTPLQWVGTIRNLQKNGVSALEIEWSGIIPALEKDTKPFLEIDELLACLTLEPPCELVLVRHVTDQYMPVVRYAKQPRPAELPPLAVTRGRREVRLLHYTDRTFGLCIWLHVEFDAGLFGRNRYWSFSVPRGRKKLTSHPVNRRFASAREAMAYGRLLVERMARRLQEEGFVGQTRSLNHYTRYVLPGGDNYTEWMVTAPNLSPMYWGPHFDVPNIIVHVRTTARLTPRGARLLVIEEIQSDWNQELREAIREAKKRQLATDSEGDILKWDDGTPPSNPYLNHWLEAGLKMMLLLASNRGFAGIAWLPGQLHAERFPWANADGLKTFYDQIVPAAVAKLAKSWGAQLGEAQFSTLTRFFEVCKTAGGKTWVVLNLESRKVEDEVFPDWDSAEAFRRTKEIAVLENVTVLYLSEEIRADIRQHGLPQLGAVGKRLGS